MTAMITPKEVRNDPLVHRKINTTPKNLDSIEAMDRESDKPVFGTFVNIECPGQPAKISAKLYKGQEYFSKTLEDGQQYTLPYSIARFINERCKYEQHSYLQDEKGQPIKTGKFMPRYKFMIEQMS